MEPFPPTNEERPKAETRHAGPDAALEETAAVLRAAAQEPGEPLGAEAKARIRTHLFPSTAPMSPSSVEIHYDASEQAQTPAAVPPRKELPTPKPPGQRRKGWFRHIPLWGSGFAGVAIVALIAIFVVQNGVLFPGKSILSAIAIPAAHAGDAFDVVPLSADAGGMETSSGWQVHSKVDVSSDQLKQALRVVPEVDLRVEKAGAGEYTVEPVHALDRGRVYQLTIATAIETEEGTKSREFSWAFQTKDAFRVLTSIPGDQSSRVPVNTGIEFTFSRDGFADALPFFAIEPAAKGRFEVRGRTLTFVPLEPLKAGTRYDVTLKKGFGIEGSDLLLAEDVHVRFETASPEAVDPGQPSPTKLGHREFFDVRPQQTVILHVYRNQEQRKSNDVEVTVYSLTRAAGKKLVQDHLSIPDWMPARRSLEEAFEKAEKTQVASLAGALVSEGNGWSDTLTLPSFKQPGLYAVRLVPRVAGGRPSWVFYQVTDAAAYVAGDDKKLAIWAVNAGTQKPLGNVPVTLGTDKTKTSPLGVAEVTTPATLVDQADGLDENESVLVLEVGEGPLSVLVPMKRDPYSYSFGWDTVSKTWSYTFIDRPLYHQQDELYLWGVAKDRDSGDRVPSVTAELVFGPSWSVTDAKVIESQTLKTDAEGRFETHFQWGLLSPGYYSMVVKRGDETIQNVGFEVRVFAKPTYFIDVKPERFRYTDGEEIVMNVKASFFDGTPLSHGKLRLEWTSGYSIPIDQQEIVLDAFGEARITQRTEGRQLFADCYRPLDPAADLYSNRCYESANVMATIHPAGGEEGDITGRASVTVFSSTVELEATGATHDLEAEAIVRTFRRTNDPADDDGRADPIRDQQVEMTIVPTWYEQIQYGVDYDPVGKKTYPLYRYERRTDEPSVVRVQTDAQGRARHAFTMRKDRWYVVTMEVKDGQGKVTRAVRSFYPGPRDWYEYPSVKDDAYPKLEIVPTDPEAPQRSIGDRVQAVYYVGTERLQAEKTPGVLFLVASRGLREVVVEPQGAHALTFDASLLPNAEVYAVTWLNGRFELTQAPLSFDKKDRALDVEVRAERASYAPGDQVVLHVKAKQREDGRVASGERVAFAAVDRALLAASYVRVEDPLQVYYGYVASGLRYFFQSHAEDMYGAGGAEKGGGGGGDGAVPIRRNFKDTAGAGSIELDGNGEGTIRFVAPDNLTSWRVQVTTVTARGYAGAASTDVPVSKPVFVDMVLPPTVNAKDQPMIKLRAFGSGLAEGTPVTYVVHAPTLGILNQTLKGKAGEPLTVAVDHLELGTHPVTVKLETSAGRDALERSMTVVGTRVTRRARMEVDAVPGMTLPDIQEPFVRVQIASRGRASLLPLLSEIDWQSRVSSRLDAKIAEQIAQKVAPLFPPDVIEADTASVAWSDYQLYDGGLMLLPYGSSDLSLSSRIAAIAPDRFDQLALVSYFQGVLNRKDSAREEQMDALAGLAALKEPVLSSLQAASQLKDLSWRERLSVVRGLEAAGDRERAASVLEPLLKTMETRDDVAWIPVSDRQAERLEASAEAAALLAARGDSRATGLIGFVANGWSEEAFPILAKAQYLKLVAPTLPDRDTRLTYAVGSKRTSMTINRGEPVAPPIVLTKAEANDFRIVSVDGPVTLSLITEVDGRPTSVPEVQIQRSYAADKPLSQLTEGDTVRVTLNVTWSQAAQPGCYTVRDFVPGGLTPIVDWSWDWRAYGVFPSEVGEGTISFYTCQGNGQTIMYTDRVVSRGSYVAEAPIVQHMDHPSIAASGRDEVVVIK